MTTSTTLEPTTTNEGFPERFIQVCPSDNFTLFLQASGDAWSCGENSRGQLGNQLTESISTPFIFGKGFVKLDVGQLHAGGLDVNKRLFLWGDGWHGEQGIDPNSISENANERFISLPTRRANSVIDFALGNARTFLITSEGSIFACGENTNGILGTASSEIHVRDFEIVTTPEGLKFEKIDAGMDHFGAIDENGALWMWGSNEFNKLALPGESIRGATKVIPANVRSVSCGEDFTIATLTNGRVLAVGKGAWGKVSSWFDVVGEPSRGYSLTEVWGSYDEDFRSRMKIIYASYSEIMLFLDDFYAFKFVPEISSGFKSTKLGRIYFRFVAPFTENSDGSITYSRSEFQYMDVTFQETGFELYEPKDFTLHGWGAQGEDGIVLSYEVNQITTTTSDPNQTTTTADPTTSSTTEQPTTSTSTTSSTSTSTTSSTTSSTTIDPATLDSDSDGVNDADDYFFMDSRIDKTETELQTWVSDPDRTLEENSDEAIVIRALRTYDNTLELGKFYLFYRDDYGVIEMTDQDGTSDGSLSADLSARGEGWEVIKPFIATTTSSTTSTTSTTEEPTTSTSSTTEEPTTSSSTTSTSTTEEPTTSTSTTQEPTTTIDSDGDGVLDSEEYFRMYPGFTYSKSDLESFSLIGNGIEMGDIIRGVADFQTEPIIPGEFYIVIGTTSLGFLCEDENGDSSYSTGQPYEIYLEDRGVTWDKVNYNNQVTSTTSTSTTSTTEEPLPTEFDNLDDFISLWCQNVAEGGVIALFPTTINTVENRNGSYSNFKNFSLQGLGVGAYQIDQSGNTITFTNPAPGYSHYSSAPPYSGGVYKHDLGDIVTGGSSGTRIQVTMMLASYTRWKDTGTPIRAFNTSGSVVNVTDRQVDDESTFIYGNPSDGSGSDCFHTLMANISFEIGTSLGYFSSDFTISLANGSWQNVRFYGQAIA